MSAIPKSILQSVAISNCKAVAEQSAMLSNLSFSNVISNVNLAQQNAVSHQQAMNQLTTAVVGKIVNLITNLSPLEAVAINNLDTGNRMASMIAGLKAALTVP